MNKKNPTIHKKLFAFSAVVKLLILLGIIVGLTVYMVVAHRDILQQMSSLEGVKEVFAKYQTEGILVYILAQVGQIVICIIPGQWLQIGAGIAWGFVGALFLSLVGAAIGTAIAYFLAGFLGRDAMHLFFGEERVNQYVTRFNSKRAMIIVFLVFLIPGLPKDLCGYIAGISQMKLQPFLVISLIGRCPGMIGSILIGTQAANHNWTAVVVISIVFAVLCGVGVAYRKRLLNWIDKAYDKMMK